MRRLLGDLISPSGYVWNHEEGLILEYHIYADKFGLHMEIKIVETKPF